MPHFCSGTPKVWQSSAQRNGQKTGRPMPGFLLGTGYPVGSIYWPMLFHATNTRFLPHISGCDCVQGETDIGRLSFLQINVSLRRCQTTNRILSPSLANRSVWTNAFSLGWQVTTVFFPLTLARNLSLAFVPKRHHRTSWLTFSIYRIR